MAPNLVVWQHALIQDMIDQHTFRDWQIAEAAECSRNAVGAIRANLQCFGTTTAPRNVSGARRSITPSMRQALLDHLWVKPDRYLDELVVFLWDDFRLLVSTSTISRELEAAGWSKKKARQEAKQRNPDLRDWYRHEISSYEVDQLLFVDESGCHRHDGFRRTAWSPTGVTPVHVARFSRGERYQILPAYTVNGILDSCIFQGSTDGAVFEDFIEQLLPKCGRWPEPHPVLIMDNASFHRSERVKHKCDDAGVKLVYLPPYSPDLNPIEEFFAELKLFIKRHWPTYEGVAGQDFAAFLRWCVDMVGVEDSNARGHFRHAGLHV